jgi:hypothetical protein
MTRLRTGTAAWWAARTRFEPSTGCVLWTGFICPQGYARASWKGKEGVLVHRIAYEQVNGPFDPSLKVCHRCDTPHCMNPGHLFLGTQKDNMRDMFAKGRARPRGTATPPLTVFPSVSARVTRRLSKPQTRKCVRIIDLLHLTRTSAIIPRWRQVTGVPSIRPTRAIVRVDGPLLRTLEPATARDQGLPTVATVAPCCASGVAASPFSMSGRGNQ